MLQAAAGQLFGSATGVWPVSAGLGDKGNRDIHLSLFSKPAWKFTHWGDHQASKNSKRENNPQ